MLMAAESQAARFEWRSAVLVETDRDVPAAEFRAAMGHFATGVTVVTSVGADGAPVGTTANAVTSLSLDPPLILVCFELSSLTLAAIREHGAFAVNVLAAGQKHLSAGFARRGLSAAWDHVRHHRHGPTGSPRIEGVLAILECTVEHRLPGGDHEIVSRFMASPPSRPRGFA
jgi:flavin reductase (DIM6/NTAB) family NADH-FMN oxidoreductase RutF